MTDRPIDPNDITPEMVEQVEDLLKRQEWNCDEHRDVIAAVLTCARRWKLGPAEDRVTLGDVMRYLKGEGLRYFETDMEGLASSYGDDLEQHWPGINSFIADVAAWKEGKR